ncbi:universal stress protein [Sphaerisporangium krabiense]|uniref:Nucleotide-binding universal stress UspA family protein n=1 Tax=Sphaerisporangium krabiense TaxID=763782 RepID=A0A7W8Z2J8_9ACTN|nr:universal stress protein [Sphaerisporangium krabiense]MBB5626192.1 nucleotide-binding universal stress UspA family protein [Sphaerisporangium krabiense]GII66141.1 universal stress protein [Sphaerisporangium krabiense]
MIIVGVDGSPAGLDAVGWAVREGALLGRPVRIVHVMPKWAAEMPEDAPHAEVGRWMRGNAATVLKEATERAAAEPVEARVTAEPAAGDPRTTLLGLAADAGMLVVGNHGLGGFRGLLLGSVALGVAGYARCPVVVVRGPAAVTSGEVVVGMDGSVASDAAVGFAFAEAAARGARLRVVRVRSGQERVLPSDPGEAADETRRLGESLAAHRERHPGVEVVAQVEDGHPARVLTEASAEADLLVVGSRGRGGFAGLLLGSTSHAVLHHASCPVAVVRGASKEDRRRE